jgi:DNA polymerase elongation subunit (family B)
MEKTFRLFDFNVYNEKPDQDDLSSTEKGVRQDNSKFLIQMFGLNEKGETCSIFVENFKPFFYVKVDDNWDMTKKNNFLRDIKTKIGNFYKDCIVDCKMVKRKKLYGFDGGKEHKFVKFEFSNMAAFNKAKNLWYTPYSSTGEHRLLKQGYLFENSETYLYEANIPPLLRFFHIQDVSPSGWIALPNKKTVKIKNEDKKTTCQYEFIIDYKHIVPLNEKETIVPFKICSFDIEASSSHGDFPIPVKTYKKLATNIIDYFEKRKQETFTMTSIQPTLQEIILTAFGFGSMTSEIDLVFPKQSPNKEKVQLSFASWIQSDIQQSWGEDEKNNIESMFEKMNQEEEDDNQVSTIDKGKSKMAGKENKEKDRKKTSKKYTVMDMLMRNEKTMTREEKINECNRTLRHFFPDLKGDEVTFIGSTLLRYGETEPYKNHCVVLNTCSPIENTSTETVLESYDNERDVLLAWKDFIQRENPDIVIGYNIFGFDYQFLFQRAQENDCVGEFLKLSRNVDEVCGTIDTATRKWKIEESSIQIASGQHDLKFIKMNGRLQVDLYNYFRREENLSSYKLDYVSGYFIGDIVKKWEKENKHTTKIKSGNLIGLYAGSYIHFEEIGHTTEYYNNGAKYQVSSVDKTNQEFTILGEIDPDTTKKIRWCMAKDDVSPKDIFRMTNGTAEDRSVIAKYCIQDCNLVHYLMNKVDILTGFVEMSKICSVPMNFLVMRGQGIKLTSYIAKKCREKRTLMPVIEKGNMDEGYEGAIVLDPKCDLYLDNPVACVDYASLYPSSMISENLSHDSKVWTQEFDLEGKLLKETGEKDEEGRFLYDNLPGYEYVNIEYDTYRYVRKTPSASAEKVICGKKICRFAQGKSIMPSILEELLQARKATRKRIPEEKDEFMKNVLDKRQLGYKVTANSLYGQCGAKTSSFYEKDIAACTTATGRLLLTYAKKVIEKCYGDRVCQLEKGEMVRTKAEYIYGDTDSVFFTFNLERMDGTPIRGKEALEMTIELAQEAGHLASSFLKGPHDLEYEKTFMPFCLLSKKRYVGMLYEYDPNKCKRKEMGIVLKRRDNAPIVKDIYGGIIDILMKEQDIQKAMEYLKECLQNIVDEKYPMEKLIITKSLRSGYKNPLTIAHKVLADRMTARDPGNKPSSGDRIPFVYIQNKNKKCLQGEKIETPQFIQENHLKIDYSFYITNQIMKPVQQVFALVIEKIWKSQKKLSKLAKFKRDTELLKKACCDNETYQNKLEDLKNKEVKVLLFDEFLRETNNEKNGNQTLSKFFSKA